MAEVNLIVEKTNVCGEIDCNFKLSHGFKDLSQIKSIGKIFLLIY